MVSNCDLSLVSCSQPLRPVGEGLVTCYTRSCTSVLYRPAQIRLQLFCIAIVTPMMMPNDIPLKYVPPAMQENIFSRSQPLTPALRCKGLAM